MVLATAAMFTMLQLQVFESWFVESVECPFLSFPVLFFFLFLFVFV